MTFPRLAKLIEKGKIATHGAYFGVATGDPAQCSDQARSP